jgi:hypothetical protein
MRFLKYDKTDYFKKHLDGVFERNNEESAITIQVYLNEGMEGRETIFYNELEDESYKIVPKIETKVYRLGTFSMGD